MLGMYSLLPLLKGWEYKIHRIARTNVVRGADPIELRVREQGWLINVALLSTDCYGTLRVTWQGADLQTQELAGNAESGIAIGAISQDPGGWVQRYLRPNPASTAGIFFTSLFSGGFQGSAWPFIPTVIMEINLPSTSTQASAYVLGSALVVAITNPKLFMISLRKLLGIKGKLDPELFVLGQIPLVEET